MSNQEVTYSNSRVFVSSSESQNPIKPNETQGPREVGHKVFQYSQEIYKLQRTLNNLRQEYSTMQNDSYLMEEMLKNKSIDYEVLKHDLDTLNRTLNRCYQETKFVDSKLHRGERVEGHWFCCGIKCYYFIMDKKRWSVCAKTCRDCSLSLLRIDDDDELKFLQLQIKPNSYWTGLSYNPRTRKWQWSDDGPSNLDLNTAKFDHYTGTCAFLSRTRLDNDNCDQLYPCICEKRLDKFTDSSCSKS
ncbi:killer cell lectin-like receptor 2 [Peromyscus californicus insignis]|uniref:killer cell lectin-like receptor 2 n=1 Tax=Peromyscus californicus insignis TaxID=564181 RepID=UPI0022A7F2B8|nr:killer cell lectin-like receptor 2 [Peromyscus californicus insignis]